MDTENKNEILEVSAMSSRGGKKENKPVYLQLALPVSILLAAIIISGTWLYTHGVFGGDSQNKGQMFEVKLTESDQILGNKNAKITILEYADFRCPFCERFDTQTRGELIKNYVETGKVKFVFRNYAFLGQESILTSEAAECAGEQGKYWEFFDWLFKNQAPESDLAYYSKDNLVKYAGKAGLNTTQLSTCLNSGKYSKKVSDDMTSGKSYGVTGTPTFLIFSDKDSEFDLTQIKLAAAQNQYVIPMENNNAFVVGAQKYETFKSVLDTLVK